MDLKDRDFYGNIGISFPLMDNRVKADLYQDKDDFNVMEMHKKNFICPLRKIDCSAPKKLKSPYLKAVLLKKGISTFEAIDIFARENGFDPNKDISYCGLKDTDGITSQLICLKNKKIRRIKFKNFYIGNFRPGYRKFKINSHSGNYFVIKARNIVFSRKNTDILNNFVKLTSKGLPNFYGPQRFGVRQDNHILGKLLLKEEYEKFLFKFITYSCNEPGNISKIRDLLKKNYGRWAECLNIIGNTKEMYYEKKLIKDLCAGSSLITAIRNMKLSGFFIHSYSSYLFNLILSDYLKRRYKNSRLIKLGKGLTYNKTIKRFYLPILKKENITLDDFNKSVFDIKAHSRQSLFYPADFSFKKSSDTLILKFGMGNGEYASLFLEFLIDSKKRKLC